MDPWLYDSHCSIRTSPTQIAHAFISSAEKRGSFGMNQLPGGTMTSSDIPPGMLPLLIEKMVQLDDLKALENNTLEMWRAMTRYEIQKEEEIKESRRRERAEILDLQRENDCLRKELMIRDIQTGSCSSNSTSCCCCPCYSSYPCCGTINSGANEKDSNPSKWGNWICK
eukprot:Gregarina_sp_Poly_1__96@NODE_1020_length_5329_cov_521_329913_g711_i0_p4_GENE_NODE_1020_length_5329_cov_521_329913_g711_i0NODE_1020_length_5329_cov_521_329913_g711_i0_p4_ORF_typecomplete_len169_score13_59Choline_kinase/PF01633_20/0_12_NODE_1020_length_5329_cov_521_329913_g711_i036724178